MLVCVLFGQFQVFPNKSTEEDVCVNSSADAAKSLGWFQWHAPKKRIPLCWEHKNVFDTKTTSVDCYPLKPIVILRKWLLSSDSESTGCSYSSQSIQCCRKKQVFTKIVSFASKKFQKWGAQNTQYKRSGPLLAVILGQTTVSFLVSLLRKKKESDCCLAWVRGGIGIWRRTLWLVSFHVLKRWMWYRRETCSNTQNILH